MHRRRDHGGVIFIDLRDREGLVQVVIDPDTPEAFSTADSCRNEFVLAITGPSVWHAAAQKAPPTATWFLVKSKFWQNKSKF